MPLIETLTISVAASLSKAVAKLWLKDPGLVGAAEGVIETVKKRSDDFLTRRSTGILFQHVETDIAQRMELFISREFPSLDEGDRNAASLARDARIPNGELSNLRSLRLQGATPGFYFGLADHSKIEELTIAQLPDLPLADVLPHHITWLWLSSAVGQTLDLSGLKKTQKLERLYLNDVTVQNSWVLDQLPMLKYIQFEACRGNFQSAIEKLKARGVWHTS
jgi:hypothetical protein